MPMLRQSKPCSWCPQLQAQPTGMQSDSCRTDRCLLLLQSIQCQGSKLAAHSLRSAPIGTACMPCFMPQEVPAPTCSGSGRSSGMRGISSSEPAEPPRAGAMACTGPLH